MVVLLARHRPSLLFVRTRLQTLQYPLWKNDLCQRSSAVVFSSKSWNAPKNEEGDEQRRLFPEEINLLYDSKCSICRWEMEWLYRRDMAHNTKGRKLRLTDIEAKEFDPSHPPNGGVTYAQAMQRMTAVTSEGKIIKGVPVFAMAYERVGLEWLATLITKWPVLSDRVLTPSYRLFAKYRTWVTRGTSLDSLLQAHDRQREQGEDCQTCKR